MVTQKTLAQTQTHGSTFGRSFKQLERGTSEKIFF